MLKQLDNKYCWASTEAKKAFQESPSLQLYYTEIFNGCYQDARELAAAETGPAINGFPIETPFTSEEILKSEFFLVHNDSEK